MTQPDLFTYPNAPGYKRQGTSQEAAQSIDAQTIRDACLACFYESDYTADEVADKLKLSVLAVRPRITELQRKGEIRATFRRRRNASGRNAIVWGRV